MSVDLNELGRKIEYQYQRAENFRKKVIAESKKCRELELQWLEAKTGLKTGCRIVTDDGTEFEIAAIGSFQIGRAGDEYEIKWRPQLDGYKIKKDGKPSKKKQYIAARRWQVKGEA